MNKIFISYSFERREEFRRLDTELRKFLNERYGVKSHSFVFDFKSTNCSNHDLMTSALQLLNESDCLIAEVSYKEIGVGVEVGYAKACGKKIIYIHNKGSELSTTVGGISDWRVKYDSIDDLIEQIEQILNSIFTKY